MEQTCFILQMRELYSDDQVITVKATRSEVKTIAGDMVPNETLTWSFMPDGTTEVGTDDLKARHVFTISEHTFTV